MNHIIAENLVCLLITITMGIGFYVFDKRLQKVEKEVKNGAKKTSKS